MKKLLEILKKKERRVIGLMSGTSLDGVDLVLTKIQGSGLHVDFKILAFETYPIPDLIKKDIKQCFQGSSENICRLNYDLGYFFSKLILEFLKQSSYNPIDIDLIGSHGQTIYHCHQHSTLQIGESEIIAQKTGIPVVSNFRAADIAVGGSGAPLVPYLDFILFKDSGKTVALQNLGGIGNVTCISGNNPDQIIAFDTGPANSILNELSEIISDGAKSYDQNGCFSKNGEVNEILLLDLLKHPYFESPLPKSTGREQFGHDYVQRVLSEYHNLKKEDILRTFIRFVTRTIQLGYQKFLPEVNLIYCSGGGASHPLIMEDLELLFGEKVRKFDSVKGITADSKEAVAFAILANEKINGNPTNIPSVTGARKPVSLGAISIPD